MSVTALFTGVVLDKAAVQAGRLALLVELTAEQLANAYAFAAEQAGSTESEAVRYLECAAGLAREVAERERARCAEVDSGRARRCMSPALAIRGSDSMPVRAER